MKYKPKPKYDVFICLNCEHKQRVRFATKKPRCYNCHSANMVDHKTLHTSHNDENFAELKLVIDNLLQKVSKLEAHVKINDKDIHTIHKNTKGLKKRCEELEANTNQKQAPISCAHPFAVSPKKPRAGCGTARPAGY